MKDFTFSPSSLGTKTVKKYLVRAIGKNKEGQDCTVRLSYSPHQYGNPYSWEKSNGTIYSGDGCNSIDEAKEAVAYAGINYEVRSIDKTTVEFFEVTTITTISGSIKKVS